MVHKILYVVYSLFAVVQGVNAQFLWKETHPSSADRVCYVYNSASGISTLGNVASVMGHIYDSTQIAQEMVAYHVSRSDDDGRTWTEQQLPLPKQTNQGISNFILQDIFQVSKSHCVVAAYDYFGDSAVYLHTFDEGKSWSRIHFSENGGIVAVHFLDSLTGVISMNEKNGVSPTVYTTSDGGKTFFKKTKLFGSIGFTNIVSRGGDRFCAFQAGMGRIFSNLLSSQTIDSTRPIADIDIVPLYWFRGCEFAGDTIIAFGYYSSDGTFDTKNTEGVIARSSDAGKTWSSIQHFPQFYMFFSGTIPNRDTVIVAGGSHLQRPMYILSTDNGITWRTDTLTIDSGSTERIEDIEMTGNGTPIAITRTKFAGGAPTIIARGKRTPSSVKANRNTSDNIGVFPNPASTSATLTLDSDEEGECEVQIISVTGATLKEYSTRLSTGKQDISLSGLESLPSGMYEVLVKRSGHQTLRTKFIVQ